MSGQEYIVIGTVVIAAAVILFAAFQLFMRRWIKEFHDTWRKY